MTAPQTIHELVDKFSQHGKDYRAGKYNETQLRRDFLDPFFAALGWDVFNQKNYSERYREVIHESSVEVEGGAKAADYAFRVGDKTIFFVEAKKPSVNIETNPEPAFQLRRYGWSAKLPLSILTDFEQLAVYDCRMKPDKADKASAGRVKLYHFSEYLEKWDEIAAIFGHDAVLQGAFDNFAEGQKGKKGTAEVDDAFLAEIEHWRDLLARNIALRNLELIRNERDLNYAVQMTIDRIIFLRICEDRGIEPDEQLKEIASPHRPSATSPKLAPLASSHPPIFDAVQSKMGGAEGGGEAGKGQIYTQLLALFRRADTKYNSGLFHFAGDTLTPNLIIDDKPLKEILHSLYYPESPYVFTYISTDILGQVYEQFLGKVIRLTAGHQAKVEEKPEVRKAGGVYYTPKYIVDYIVKNTVGALLDGKSADSQRQAPIKVLDPACGSGSFLLGAYQFLLDWYLAQYTEHDPEKWAKGSNPAITKTAPTLPSPKLDEVQSNLGEVAAQYPQGAGRRGLGWSLTTNEKKRILLDHIHGVDIDAQAVEVTKLSLLLKVLEGASGQLSLGFERVLPDLGNNIKCGNSLIGPDYYDNRQMPMFPDEEFYRVNVFDWKKAFPSIFFSPTGAASPNFDEPQSKLGEGREGAGFDAIIGNPPYVRQESLSEFKNYFQKHYQIYNSTADLYAYFIELSLRLTRTGGKFSFIVSSKFVRSGYGEQLRKHIPSHSLIEKFLDFGDLPVFEGATVYPCIFILEKETNSEKQTENKVIVCNVQTLDFADLDEYIRQNGFLVAQANLMGSEWSLHPGNQQDLLQKITSKSKTLKEYCGSEPLRGVLTGLNEVFIVPDEKINQITLGSEQERSLFLPYLRGRNVHRYYYEHTGENLLFSDGITEKSAPNVMAYMKKHKEALEARTDIQGTSKKWFELRPCKYYDLLKKPKIIYASVAQEGNFVLDEVGTFVDKTCYFIPSNDKYLLGLLNSKLLFYYFSHIAVQRRGGYFEYLTIYVSQLPIRPIDFNNPTEKAAHERMVSLVETMLELHKRLPSARTPQEKEMLARQVSATDESIDRLVYQLYGLDESEIAIVEGK